MRGFRLLTLLVLVAIGLGVLASDQLRSNGEAAATTPLPPNCSRGNVRLVVNPSTAAPGSVLQMSISGTRDSASTGDPGFIVVDRRGVFSSIYLVGITLKGKPPEKGGPYNGAAIAGVGVEMPGEMLAPSLVSGTYVLMDQFQLLGSDHEPDPPGTNGNVTLCAVLHVR